MKSFQFFRLKVTNVAIAELADRGRHWNVRKRNVREQNIWDRNVPEISLLDRNLWGRKIAEKKFRSAFWCKSFIKSFYSPFHQCETGCCRHCRIRNIWVSLFLCWSAFIAVGFYPGGTQRKHYCFFVEFFSLCCWAFNVGFYPRLTQTLLGFNTERDDRTLQSNQTGFFGWILLFVQCYSYCCCYYLFNTKRRTLQSGQTGFCRLFTEGSKQGNGDT